MTRVLVTGIGIVSPLGRGARETMRRLVAGDRAIGPLRLFELAGVRAGIAAECEVGEVPRGWSRADVLAVAAAREALAEAALEPHGVELYVGGTTGGMFECEQQLATLTRAPSATVDRERMQCHPLSASADRLQESCGPFAASRSVCAACSGGAVALWLAAVAIRAGRIERALAGGVDALCRLTYAGFSALGALDPQPCRPFDETRAGLSLGEGAAFLVLESEASARARGREPIAELAGWAAASESHHITHPEPHGATAAGVMRAALGRAGLGPRALDYVNAHGTATPHNDVMEAAAIRDCLGAEADRVPVSSIKGAIGHTLGAAGAIEAAVSALAVQQGVVPPTAGLKDPDAACALRHVVERRPGRVRAALSNAFGFGGTDVALVFAEPGLGEPPAPRRDRVVVTGASALGPLGAGTGGHVLGYLEPGPHATEAPARLPEGALDPMRARRMERAARLFTHAAALALGDGPPPADVALVAGSAWGSPEATGSFLLRLFEKGPRFASPAVFPGALPSSLASHASIYLGLRGAAFTTADLGTSGECALAIAIDLVAAGETAAVVAGAVEELSEVALRVSSPVSSALPDRGRRGEGAAALLVESESAARARGATPLCVVSAVTAWRGRAPEIAPPKGERAVVIVAREETPVPPCWADRPVHVLAARAGDHESVGAIALAAAAGALSAGAADEVLVLGGAPDRGYACLLSPPGVP
jgi:3-oxoacyl-[acyl-carrier-protein] synthase II